MLSIWGHFSPLTRPLRGIHVPGPGQKAHSGYYLLRGCVDTQKPLCCCLTYNGSCASASQGLGWQTHASTLATLGNPDWGVTLLTCQVVGHTPSSFHVLNFVENETRTRTSWLEASISQGLLFLCTVTLREGFTHVSQAILLPQPPAGWEYKPVQSHTDRCTEEKREEKNDHVHLSPPTGFCVLSLTTSSWNITASQCLWGWISGPPNHARTPVLWTVSSQRAHCLLGTYIMEEPGAEPEIGLGRSQEMSWSVTWLGRRWRLSRSQGRNQGRKKSVTWLERSHRRCKGRWKCSWLGGTRGRVSYVLWYIHICHPGTLETDAIESGIQDHPGPHSEFRSAWAETFSQTKETPLLQNGYVNWV